MFISAGKGQALFRTPYSEKYDLVQKFRGMEKGAHTYNEQVDFMEAGLIRRDKWDMWHLDIPLAVSNDEAVPCIINGAWIGGGHGHPGCVDIYAPAHDKTAADIGSVWKDEIGVTFTLLRTVNEDCLTFISENLGDSKEDYQFAKKIEGALTFVSDGVHTSPIAASDAQNVSYLTRAYRFTKMRLLGIKDGKARLVHRSMECDSARIEEEYEIKNPATVAPALTAARPKDGYKKAPDLADFGETMLMHRMVYHILEDGTVLCEFHHEKVMDVRFERWMGAMYQEKQDAFGGGIFRTLPKTLPFETPEGRFDFSVPTTIAPGPYPKCFFMTKEYWENPASPPDRVVDYFRDGDGHDRLGFACGYLPLHDGAPEKRLQHLTHSIMLYGTRKIYPTFMNGELTSVRGYAYKKYFRTEKDGASVYTVKAEGKTFVFMDFLQKSTLSMPAAGKVALYEKSDTVSYDIKDGTLSASGKGYAVFIIEGE